MSYKRPRARIHPDKLEQRCHLTPAPAAGELVRRFLWRIGFVFPIHVFFSQADGILAPGENGWIIGAGIFGDPPA
jgi:hypothetical protein